MAEKFKAVRDGFILGTFYSKDENVPVTATQAKYLTAPYGDDLVIDDGKAATKSK